MFTALWITSFIPAILVAGAAVLILKGTLKNIISRLVGEAGSIYWSHLVCFTVFLYALTTGMGARAFEFSLKNDLELEKLTLRMVAYAIYAVAWQTLTAITYALIAFSVIAVIMFLIIRALEVIEDLIQRKRT